ncbi:DUF389 domain-containing protein [Neptunitalea chrysea]|uniref:DUF389 domain-containing protein n=1 Tax=Neptunitalea chrysea TaxID=1647581 RepID=A0A9W6EWP1_9FLAO|nr:DUF389 domain-containing protein [Neptunitalea chrysea]GLB53288.1 DUF389 domain-containing protein [Neptunitalea chrysea]
MKRTSEKNDEVEGELDNSTTEVKKDFTGFIGSLKKFLVDLLDIRENTDSKSTIEGIKADIPFKGHTAWILVCSIFIASIGLNANSNPVVIGAMLISPLMGPILGMGLSLAINDIDTLKRSLNNFLVMVGLSVLTAFLFFSFFPLKDQSSELLARTQPDIRDVLIAFFGGMAVVIARAKRGTIASVIFGVAIATALMPPLCTVGYGLAVWQPDFFLGALYLFVINTIFIGLATYLVLKVLKLPMVRYANSKRRKRTMQLASVVALIVMAPAIYTFYKVFQEAVFVNQASKFIDEHIKTYTFDDQGFFIDKFSTISYNDGEDSTIELVFGGDEEIPQKVVETWITQKDKYPRLKEAKLEIKGGGKDRAGLELSYMKKINEYNKEQIKTKDEELVYLREELVKAQKNIGKHIPFEDVSKELKINYPEIGILSYGNFVSNNFKKLDTVTVFNVKWNDSIKLSESSADRMAKIQAYLRQRLKDTRIEVKQMESD